MEHPLFCKPLHAMHVWLQFLVPPYDATQLAWTGRHAPMCVCAGIAAQSGREMLDSAMSGTF